MKKKTIQKLYANPFKDHTLSKSALINGAPKIPRKSNKLNKKYSVSNTTEYNIMVTLFAVESFSWFKNITAVADPPSEVGETVEANSQRKISSIALDHVKRSSDMIFNRQL